MSNRIPARPIKKSTIEENRERLLNAPVKEKEDFSLQEAIHDMATEINQILDRGYSYDEIATMLKDGGIEIKPTTLRQYLAQVAKVTTKAKPKRSPKVKTDEVKTDEVKTDEVKTDEVKTDEVKTDEVKTDEVKTDEVKTDEVKTDEVKTDEVKTDEVKTDEVESNRDRVKTDIVDVAAKPSKSSKSAVKVAQNASSGFVEMPDKL